MGWRRRAVVRSTLRWFSTTGSRTMLVFCAIATPRPRAPTSCDLFVRRFNVACTPAQPHSCLASHNFQQGRTRSRSATRATSTAHLLGDARRKCTPHTTARAAVGAQRIRPAAFCLPALWPTCCHCHATPATPHTITLRPALPGSCPSRCAVYTAPPSPNARPARPAAVACDVCAMQCAVTMLVWCALSDTIGSAASC